MSEYLFLYRGGNTRAAGAVPSPEQMQQTMQKWTTWIKGLIDGGHLKEAGQPLEAGGKVVTAGNGVNDGPYAEKDLVCGYSIVEASDLSAAVELSSGCPIFDAGGLVEVRPVIKLNQ